MAGNRGKQTGSGAVAALSEWLAPQVLRGSGEFKCGDVPLTSRFTLTRYPHEVTLALEEADIAQDLGQVFTATRRTWELVGSLEDGRHIDCDNLHAKNATFSSAGSSSITLTPLGLMTVGVRMDGSPDKVTYPLMGYYDGALAVSDDGWQIAVEATDMDTKLAALLKSGWKFIAEGMQLVLSHPNASIDEYEGKARQVMQLLPLACGHGVTCHRLAAVWDDQVYETWGQGVGGEPGPGPCVPSFQMHEFLRQTLPIWRGWDDKRRESARIITAYINSSHTGYLDTKLLTITQAWEIAALEWGESAATSTDEQFLKTQLRQVWKAWREGKPGLDSDGRLWERIAFAFRWSPALARIRNLADSRRIDVGRLGIDFGQLKSARDAVAHRGRMPREMDEDPMQTLMLLRVAQFGLQLVLLVDLGYDGLVETVEKGWKVRESIRGFLLPAADPAVTCPPDHEGNA